MQAGRGPQAAIVACRWRQPCAPRIRRTIWRPEPIRSGLSAFCFEANQTGRGAVAGLRPAAPVRGKESETVSN